MTNSVESAVEIRPFHIDVADEALDDLRRRIAATNWPEKETVADHSQGVPLAMTVSSLGPRMRTPMRGPEAFADAVLTVGGLR